MTRYGDDVEASNSELQAFLDCGRRWWLSYFRRLTLKQEAVVGPLSVGGRIHRVLEEGYSMDGAEAAFKMLSDLLVTDYPIAAAMGADVLKKFESEAELCQIMLEGFVDWAAEEGLDAGWEVIAHERIVKTPPIEVHGTNVVLKGKLDQMVRRDMDGSVFMRDWKTTITSKPVMMAFAPQLKMYLLLLAMTEPDAQVSGGQFVFLRKVKRTARAEPPFFWVEPIYLSSVEMGNFFTQTVGTLERLVETTLRLEAGESHHELVPPRPTRDCSWKCPFFQACGLFDDGSDVERYLEDHYQSGDPYSYYDEDANKGDET